MFRRTALKLALLGTVALMSNSETFAATGAPDHKLEVVQLLKAIETGDGKAVGVINPAQYKQHNLAVGDGLAGFGAALKALPPNSAKVNTVRVFQDGDFVFAHTDYNFFGPKIGFDVFRFENGKIVEHWDNLQETPTRTNASGHTMLDGPTKASDLGNTEANKAVVRGFVADVLTKRDMSRVSAYIDSKTYIQHNPNVADGADAMVAAFAKLEQSGKPHRYTATHKILGEGDFVLATSEGTVAGTPTAFYDLFRVKDGHIVEHWDTLETIPPRADWKNSNGKF